MTADDGEVRYENVFEAEDKLPERGISDEVIDGIHTPVLVAVEEILRQHNLPGHIEVPSWTSLATSLTRSLSGRRSGRVD